MKVLNYESTNGAQDEHRATQGIHSNLGFHFVRGFWVKSLKSQSAELSGLAAASSRGFTGANLNLVAELVPLELAGMHGSRMVASGSHSGPCADSLARSNNGQRVSNIDVDNFVPTDGNRSERVGDNHALIENLNLWSNEYQVSSDDAGYRPEAARDGQQGFFGQPKGDGEQRGQGKYQPGQNVATARSKDLSITHVSIIAGDK